MIEILLVVTIWICGVIAQYKIGSFKQTIVNPAFPHHDIPVEVYYPKSTSSNDLFPTIIFLHGFECDASWYTWLYKDIVPTGIVVAYINSYFPGNLNGTQFAIDQRYTLQWMNTIVNNNKSSPLYNLIDTSRSMASGHSEGGGSSIIAMGDPYINSLFNNKYKFNSIFVMAPCGQGGAGQDAQNIDIPTFVFTGSMDCICPSEEAIHLFDSIPNSDCKYLADVTNATHCQWLNVQPWEEVCNDAELDICKALHPNNNVTISLQKQLDIADQYLALFLKATITDNSNNQQDFNKITTQLNDDKKAGGMSQVQISKGCSNM